MVYGYCFRYGINCNDLNASVVSPICDRNCFSCAYCEQVNIDDDKIGGNLNNEVVNKKPNI